MDPREATANDQQHAVTARVLVVDDDPRLCQMMVAALPLWGYGVTVAPDGATALHLIQADLPDLVLTDANMPIMDGPELIRRCRADARTGALPIIAVSGATDHLRSCTTAGATRSLLKPLHLPDLAQCIAECLAEPPG